MKKEEIHIDAEFIDHSWQEMSKILDTEMPVKKRKRRFIWIWLIGLGLITWGVCEYYTYTVKQKNIVVASINEVKQTQDASIKQSNNIESIPSKSSINSNPDLAPDKESSNDLNLISTIKKITYPSIPDAKQSTFVSEAGIFKDVTLKKSDLLPIIPTDYTPIISSNTIKEVYSSKKPLTNSSIQKEMSFLEKLPSLDVSLLQIEDRPTTFMLHHQMLPSKWQFGLYAGKLMPKIGSFRAGLNARYQINPKWSIYFGVGYSRRVFNRSKNNTNQAADAVSTDSGFGLPESEEDMTGINNSEPMPPPTSDPTGILGSGDLITNTITIENIHYFELPLLAQYQLNSRLSIALGGQVSRIYGYRYNLGALQQDDNSYFTADLTAFPSEFSRSTNTTIPTNITPWELTALGGFGYQVNSNIQAYSNFHYGINSYLKTGVTATNVSKRRQIEVGIRYYFK